MRAALALVAALAAAPAAAETISALGTWTVSQVRNDPSMTVTALVDDDPAYFGATLTFSAGGVTWGTAQTNGEGTYDPCGAPRFTAAGGAIAVACGGRPWGPGATLKPLSRDRLELTWYDGAILTLSRD